MPGPLLALLLAGAASAVVGSTGEGRLPPSHPLSPVSAAAPESCGKAWDKVAAARAAVRDCQVRAGGGCARELDAWSDAFAAAIACKEVATPMVSGSSFALALASFPANYYRDLGEARANDIDYGTTAYLLCRCAPVPRRFAEHINIIAAPP